MDVALKDILARGVTFGHMSQRPTAGTFAQPLVFAAPSENEPNQKQIKDMNTPAKNSSTVESLPQTIQKQRLDL